MDSADSNINNEPCDVTGDSLNSQGLNSSIYSSNRESNENNFNDNLNLSSTSEYVQEEASSLCENQSYDYNVGINSVEYQNDISDSLYGEDDPVTNTYTSIYSGNNYGMRHAHYSQQEFATVSENVNMFNYATASYANPIGPTIPEGMSLISLSSNMLPSILNKNQTSSTLDTPSVEKKSPVKQTAFLRKDQLKRRLHSFSLMKQGLAAKPINKIINLKQPKVQVQIGVEEYDENGQKVDDKIVFVKKPPKKGPDPHEKAKAVIDEIEQIKRREEEINQLNIKSKYSSKYRKSPSSRDFPSPDRVYKKKTKAAIEELAERVLTAEDNHPPRRESFKRVSRKEKKFNKKFRSRHSVEREKEKDKPLKRIFDKMPENWDNFKDWQFDFKKIAKLKERKSKLSEKVRSRYKKNLKRSKDNAMMDLKSLLHFNLPSLPRYPFVARARQTRIKLFPQELIKYTEKLPTLSYCENPTNPRGYFQTRKTLFEEVPQGRIEHMQKIIEQKPKSSICVAHIEKRNWYPKTNFLIEEKYIDARNLSYGLSVLTKNYDDQDEILEMEIADKKDENNSPVENANDITDVQVDEPEVCELEVCEPEVCKPEVPEPEVDPEVVDKPEKKDDATPDTDEYRSNWESDDDNLSVIMTTPENDEFKDGEFMHGKSWISHDKEKRQSRNYRNPNKSRYSEERETPRNKSIEKNKYYDDRENLKKLDKHDSAKKDVTSNVRSHKKSPSMDRPSRRLSREEEKKLDRKSKYPDKRHSSEERHHKSSDKGATRRWSKDEMEPKTKFDKKVLGSSDDYVQSDDKIIHEKKRDESKDHKRKSDKYVDRNKRTKSPEPIIKKIRHERPNDEDDLRRKQKSSDNRKSSISFDEQEHHKGHTKPQEKLKSAVVGPKWSTNDGKYDKHTKRDNEYKTPVEDHKKSKKNLVKEDKYDTDNKEKKVKEKSKDQIKNKKDLIESQEKWSTDEDTHKSKKKSKHKDLKEDKHKKSKKSKKHKKSWNDDESSSDSDSKKVKETRKKKKSDSKKSSKKEDLKKSRPEIRKGDSSSEEDIQPKVKDKEVMKPKVQIDFNDFEKSVDVESFIAEPIANNVPVHELDKFPRYKAKIKIDYSDFEQSFLESEIKMDKKIVNYIEDIEIDKENQNKEIPVTKQTEPVTKQTEPVTIITKPVPEIEFVPKVEVEPVAPPMSSPELPTTPVAKTSILVSEYEEFMKAVCGDGSEEMLAPLLSNSVTKVEESEEPQELMDSIDRTPPPREIEMDERHTPEDIKPIRKSSGSDSESDKSSDSDDLSSEISSSDNSESSLSHDGSDTENIDPHLVKIKIEKMSDEENEISVEVDNQKRKLSPDNTEISIKKIKTDVSCDSEIISSDVKYNREKEWESDNSLLRNNLPVPEVTSKIEPIMPLKYSIIDLAEITIPSILPENIPLPGDIIEPIFTPTTPKVQEIITNPPYKEEQSPTKQPAPFIPIKLLTPETCIQAAEVPPPVEESIFGKFTPIDLKYSALDTEKRISSLYEGLPNIELRSDLIPNRKRPAQLAMTISPFKRPLLENVDNNGSGSDSDVDFTDRFIKTDNKKSQKEPAKESKESDVPKIKTECTEPEIKKVEIQENIKVELKDKSFDKDIKSESSVKREHSKLRKEPEGSDKKHDARWKEHENINRSKELDYIKRKEHEKSDDHKHDYVRRKEHDKSDDHKLDYIKRKEHDKSDDHKHVDKRREHDDYYKKKAVEERKRNENESIIKKKPDDKRKDDRVYSSPPRKDRYDPRPERVDIQNFNKRKPNYDHRELDRSREGDDRKRERSRSCERSLDRCRERSLDRSRERSLERCLDRNLDRSHERSLDRNRERSLDRNRERSLDRNRERSLDRNRERSREHSRDRSRERSRERAHREFQRDRDRRKVEDRRRTPIIKPRDRYSRNSRERELERYRARDRSKERAPLRDYDRDKLYKHEERERKSSRSLSREHDRRSFDIPTLSRSHQDDTDFSTTHMDIVQSPINSPLDGFKRSLADSTISDSELLLQKSHREDSVEPSPKYAIPSYPPLSGKPKRIESPSSPKRISLDDRINLVLGIEKEPPKQIESLCSRGQYEYQPSYDQYGYNRNDYDSYNASQSDNYGSSYSNQYESRYYNPAQNSSNNIKVVQVGNVIQVVPTAKPVLPSVPPAPKVNEPQPKILQVGNVLQIVPIPIVESTSKIMSLPLPASSPADESPILQIKTVEQIIQERRAEKEKRRQDRELRRKEKEKKRKEKEKRKQLKMQLKTENMIKRALSMETGEGDLDTSNLENEIPDIETTASTWPPILSVTLPLPNPPDKGILISSGFRSSNVEPKEEQLEIKKVVKFADGICPGEGTSPSAGEDLPSPPPPPKKLPKEKRYKKMKNKKKVKVKIVRNPVPEEEDDSEDNLPPPPPPPGSPPPHLWPPRVKPVNNIHPSLPPSVFPPSPFPQTVLYPPAYPQNIPVVMHTASHGPPPPPPPQVSRHHPPVIPVMQSGPPNPAISHHGPPFHH